MTDETKMIDILGDGSLMKEILVEAPEDAEVCPKTAKVVVHYTGTLMSGVKFDSSVDRGDPFEFTVGRGQVIQGWDRGIPGMKIGEKCRLTIASHLAYGEAGSGATIPPNSDLQFVVELFEFEEEDTEYPIETSEKIVAAVKRRTDGNALFKDGKAAKATKKYTKALELLENLWEATAEEEITAAETKAAVLSNLAACDLKTEKFADAAKHSREALAAIGELAEDSELRTRLEPKAQLRLARALVKLRDFDAALSAASKAGEPGKKIVSRIERMQKREEAEQRRMYKKMFKGVHLQEKKAKVEPEAEAEVVEPALEVEADTKPVTPVEELDASK
eukprot:gnl/Dysnectes_brevis/138_a163_7678.p1 GENE.gnl/Dysnectes_brevis/138_a163_7678~~gnl/Dysnectes_brevis/138_a163_7678.p1  ORF type:complete len:334 (-),score=118.44 gnl/Dysnectes_brevis/138_a163_7678:34-1035(-)